MVGRTVPVNGEASEIEAVGNSAGDRLAADEPSPKTF
jgi:hypothetical protein